MGKEETARAALFHYRNHSSQLPNTYVQALFILNTHGHLTSSTLGMEKEFQEAKPPGQSPTLVSKGTGI